MNDKIMLVSFHCDNCGNDFNVSHTVLELEKVGKYYCIHCGISGSRLYSYDDFYVKRVK